MIEALADLDDNIAEKYLEGHEISVNELKAAIRKATLALKFIGVIPGSSFKNKGIQMVLDSVVDYLPSPLDLPPMTGEADGEQVEIPALQVYLKDVRDAVEEDKRGRGNTRIERYSENIK